MALLSILRLFTSLLSLAVLATCGYLLWSWYDAPWAFDAQGDIYRAREAWRLWTGLGLLAWSFLGRFLVLPLLTHRDTRPSRAVRSDGKVTPGATGSELYVETHGQAAAPAIVFTHGWGMDSTFWNYAKQDLADRFRVIAWDLPGLGKSRLAANRPVCLPDFAADLGGLLRATPGGPVVLVGHSIGGMTIQTLIRDHPEQLNRVAGVVLLNTTYTNPLKTMIMSGLLRALQKPVLEPAMHLAKWLHPLVWLSAWQSYLSGSAHMANRLGFGDFVTASQLEHVTLLATRNPPAVQMKGNLAMLNWDATGALARCTVPILVIGGDKDIITKLEASGVMSGDNPRAQLKVVEDVNHLGPMERADLYNDLIADFALSVQPSATRDLGAGARASAPDGSDRWPQAAELRPGAAH